MNTDEHGCFSAQVTPKPDESGIERKGRKIFLTDDSR